MLGFLFHILANTAVDNAESSESSGGFYEETQGLVHIIAEYGAAKST